MGDDITLPEPPHRRSFTAEYKLAVLTEYNGATDPGAKGALLRPEGLYSSHIVEWRRARDAGAIARLAARPKPRDSRPRGPSSPGPVDGPSGPRRNWPRRAW